MAQVDLETAKDMYKLWLEAERNVTKGQSYKIGSRSLTRADIDDIRSAQQYWLDVIDELETGKAGIKVRYLHPCSF